MADPFKKNQADLIPRDLNGKFSKIDPPWISFSITNPITYIRKWWKAVMDGEGIDVRLKIHPLTAVGVALAIGGFSFGLGRFSMIDVIAAYVPILATPMPTVMPTPNPWRQAALVGLLKEQGGKFYLIGSDTQAILLDTVPEFKLTKFLGRKILASGEFNAMSLVLKVTEASDLELISGSQPVPTIVPAASESGAQISP